MSELFTTQHLVSLLTLVVLEIVLGIDNVIFIAILSSKLPQAQQARARTIGIAMAVITRVILLIFISFIMGLTQPLFNLLGRGISGRDLILIVGGLFLIGKSVHEIHDKLEAEEHTAAGKAFASMTAVIVQIMLIDIIFSLDSVITAVGISGELIIMIIAVVAAAAVMLFFSGPVARFVEKHPTMKILALAFLILIGAVLVFEGFNPEAAHELRIKNYVYFAMAFAFGIELLNMQIRKKGQPVVLHNRPSVAALPDTHVEMASDVY